MSKNIKTLVCDNIKITQNAFHLLISLLFKENLKESIKELTDLKCIDTKRGNFSEIVGYAVTNIGRELLKNISADLYSTKEPVNKIEDLAKQLKEIFPKGKKDGTNYYWSDGIPVIVRRLKLFYKKYGEGYTPEQITTAAKKYVEGFNGNYQFMKILKYFIFKEKVGAAGDVEGESELISYIENAGQEENLKNDWTSNLV